MLDRLSASAAQGARTILGSLVVCIVLIVLLAVGLAASASGASTIDIPYALPAASVLGIIAILCALILWLGLSSRTHKLQEGAEVREQRNQQAILRLLDEMGGLANGDLTVEATVSEDITGAIADSVNYTIEALRDLVTTINATAEQVAAASGDSLKRAEELISASRTQTRQIITTTETVQQMAEALKDISKNATQASEVASRSLSAANAGGDAVRRTIEGMDGIRGQIQETAKRIKRLGESSQEIGDIVEIITDIADQTNTLALNASIQAAMAGEAGRGFAVVADEVQRLAERAGHSTKRIEALVSTIQTDTNEAVISMERSTSGVVEGARLAEDAGHALEEIEEVTQSIASLVQEISQATRRRAGDAGTVAETMGSIQAITERTERGTGETGEAVGKLAELAVQLRDSVSGFRLPQQDA